MGATVATNALLERKCTPTLLLITEGFRDLPVACSRNAVELPDGSVRDLAGNDRADLPAGAVFVMETPGGGGWGEPD